jgi:hypothetical protein
MMDSLIKRVLLAMVLLIPAVSTAQPLWIGDRREVAVDQALLNEALNRNVRQFDLPIDGRVYRVDVDRVSAPNLGVTSLGGRIDDDPESFFLLCRTESGAVIAFFKLGGGQAYRLDHRNGFDEVHEVDVEALGGCAGGVNGEELRPESGDHPQPALPRPSRNATRDVADDGSRHDILIGYTPGAEEAMGGNDYIRAEVQLAVDVANLTYSNSEITSSLRLVHTMLTDYDEITAWEYLDHLAYLWYPSDGNMDDMLTMRESVGADFVSVFIDGRNFTGDVTTCGLGPVMQPHQINQDFEDLALSIVSVQCAASVWTLAHEVGHNRGCAHNREDASTGGAFPYAYGHRFWDDNQVGFRTVMSYDTNPAGGFERIPYFSNPEISYAGEPTGVSPGLEGEAHNALVHNNTAPACAAFRSERTFVEFNWGGLNPNGLILAPYRSISEAIWGSREGGTIAILDDNPDFVGVLEDVRGFVHEGEGSTVLGGM